MLPTYFRHETAILEVNDRARLVKVICSFPILSMPMNRTSFCLRLAALYNWDGTKR